MCVKGEVKMEGQSTKVGNGQRLLLYDKAPDIVYKEESATMEITSFAAAVTQEIPSG